MKNTDARHLPNEVQQHTRNQAIRLFKNGKSRKEIAEIVQVHYDVACSVSGKRAVTRQLS